MQTDRRLADEYWPRARGWRVVVSEKGTFCKEAQRELFGVMEMFNTLIVVAVLWVQTFSKSH